MGKIVARVKDKIIEYLNGILEKPEITMEEFDLLMAVYDKNAMIDKYVDLIKSCSSFGMGEISKDGVSE